MAATGAGWHNAGMPKNRETRTVQLPSLLAVGSRPDVLAWRQQSGMFFTKDGNPVRVGVPGLADAGCIVAVTVTPDMIGKTIGVAVQAEFKAGGQQSEAQANWQQAVQQRGGVYRLVRSADDMLALVAEVQSGNVWR